MRHYLTESTTTPQSEPLPGQIPNSAGGHSWETDKWLRLRRFLILGSEAGTYYISERKLTRDNIEALRECVTEDGSRVVEMILSISAEGIAPRNDQAIFALAYVFSHGDAAAKESADHAFPFVVRIGTHLFMFAEFIEALSGWGRAKRRAVADWYLDKTTDKLAYQLVKYRQRNGFTHRDLLRLAHPKPLDRGMAALLRWAVSGEWLTEMPKPSVIEGYEIAQGTVLSSRKDDLVREYRLPREALPTEWLNDPKVWEALLVDMPMTAMVRNLGNMTRIGLLVPFSTAASDVAERIVNVEQIKRSKIHPMQLLMAQMTYASGHGMRGKHTWTPVPHIVEALDAAFYLSFQNVEPNGKRHILGIDWSASMGGSWRGGVGDVPGLSPAMAAAAMALVTANVEPNYLVLAFATTAKPVSITKGMRLADAMRETARNTGEGTDCAVPILVAASQGIDTDAFVLYTDNETWAGRVHPARALEKYRNAVGHQVRMVNVGMVANNFTVADPGDPDSLDVTGFDASTPRLIADFVAGRI